MDVPLKPELKRRKVVSQVDPKPATVDPVIHETAAPPRVVEAARLSTAEIVDAWATAIIAAAPARHHRDFGEYMVECLPDLVKRLEAK